MTTQEKQKELYFNDIKNTVVEIKRKQDYLSAISQMYIAYFCPFKVGDKLKVTNKTVNRSFESIGIVYAIFLNQMTGEFSYQLKKILKDGTKSQIDLWHPSVGTEYEKVEEVDNVN